MGEQKGRGVGEDEVTLHFRLVSVVINPLNTDKLRIYATFRQQMAFLAILIPISSQSSRKVLSSMDSGHFFRFEDVF